MEGLGWAVAAGLASLAIADICPRPSPDSLLASKHKDKSCPDFKAKETASHCCPSGLEPGLFYCCTQEDIDNFEAAERSKVWKEFVSNYIGIFVVALLLCGTALLCVVYCICRRYCLPPRPCRWYTQEGEEYNSTAGTRIFNQRGKRRSVGRAGEPLPPSSSLHSNLPLYRPVETTPPKIYEAPPPYEKTAATRHLPPPAELDQQRNHWNCLIENEVNDGRPVSLPL